MAHEGIRIGTRYNKDIPDRHIYAYWDYVMNKWSWDATGYPWAPRYYQGRVEYSQDMCPQTLDYLGRVITIGISQSWTEADADDVIAAVRKVAAVYYQ